MLNGVNFGGSGNNFSGDFSTSGITTGGDYMSSVFGPSSMGGGYSYGGSNSYGFTM
jgi:hypothetical protein